MIWESRWHAAFRRKLKGQEQSDSPWTALQPGILNSVKCLFLEDLLLFIFKQYLFSYWHDIMLHCCTVCSIRCTHSTYLVVPVGLLEPGNVNASHLLKMSVYSAHFQVVRKWTHWILFPCFSPNLFSYIVKPFIFLRDKGSPCSLFQGRLWWL